MVTLRPAVYLSVCVVLVGCLLPVRAAKPDTVTVFAAASLSEALRELASTYERNSGTGIVLNFAGSGTLARQIEMGAPADLFFSADEKVVDSLAQHALVAERKALLSNTLCVALRRDSSLRITSASGLAEPRVRRIAMGNARTVAVGSYAQAWLEKLGLWSTVAPKMVPCESVRAVLATVESGNVDAGIVFSTDIGASRRVRAAFEVPKAEGPEIRYWVAKLKPADNMQGAAAFMEYLCSPSAAVVFRQRGFIVLH